jgi:hypothetical protein
VQDFSVIEGFDADLAAARQRYSPPHEVRQLAHIARPGVLFETNHQFPG